MSTAADARRLIREGAANYLTDAELLQSLLGIDATKAKAIMSHRQERWPTDAYSPRQLRHAHKLTERQADVLSTTLEIACRTRRQNRVDAPRSRIAGPDDVAELNSDLSDKRQEHLVAILLDEKMGIVDRFTIYTGTCSAATIRAAEIIRHGVIANTPRLIVAHNHPSGDPTPSPEDVAMTKELKQAADLMHITLEDHVVIGRPEHVSIREANRAIWKYQTAYGKEIA